MNNFHTIVMLIGPSNSGKSYFYNQVLKPQLDNVAKELKEDLQVVYLSSDEIRRQILGYPAHKMSPAMMRVSSDAFKILNDRLKMSSSYPVNAHFIIVDSTGLSEEFRKQVAEVAKQNHYNLEAVVFDYKDNEDYLSHIVEDEYSYTQKKVTMDHLKRLRQDVLKTLKRDFKSVTRFKSKEEVNNFKLSLPVSDYNRHLLEEKPLTVIGDIHGCLEDFKNLLLKLEVKMEGDLIVSIPEKVGQLILIGDIIDKGPDSGAVIEFVHKNKKMFTLIQGNHEHWVVNELDKDSGLDEEIKKEYFNSFYEINDTQKTMLKELYSQSFNFFKNNHCIITHAPCLVKHLGKRDSASEKLMRKTKYMKKDKDFNSVEESLAYDTEQFSYIQSEKNRLHPLHIFGHKTFPKAMKWDNKIALDSGGVYGGYLSAITVNEHGKIQFTSLKTEEKVPFGPNGIVAPFCETLSKEVKYELSDFDKQRINKLAQEKVQFISGTVSPADKNLDTKELESLEKGLEYFISRGVKKVVLQKKHMGSRCNIYLSQNLAECKAVSRNGFLVKLDLTSVFSTLQTKFKKLMEDNKFKTLILDGELMPWSALGKGLISEQYELVCTGVASEMKLLEENNFQEELDKLCHHSQKESFDALVNKTSKNKLVDQFGYQLYHSLVSLKDFSLDIAKEKANIEKYQTQVALYGAEKSVHFLPFMLLKSIAEDGSEKVYISENESTASNYRLVSDEECVELDLTDKPLALSQAQKFYDQVVSQGEEGIVIKPEFTFVANCAPFIKVRNKEYLRIIYGYNYTEPEIYQDLIQSKKIGKKLRVSQNEYAIAKALLEIKVDEISPSNPDYVSLITQMIAQEVEEQKIDHRL